MEGAFFFWDPVVQNSATESKSTDAAMLNMIFGLPLYHAPVAAHRDIKPKLMREIDKVKRDPRCLTERDNDRVYSDYRLGNDPITHGYRDLVLASVRPNIVQFGESIGAANMQMGSIWFQQYERYSFHNTHTHWPSLFSVVYYLEFDPKEHQPTAFLNPARLQLQLYVNSKIEAQVEFRPDVTEGDIVVFPGYLDHYAPLCNSDKKRTVVSFNFDVTG